MIFENAGLDNQEDERKRKHVAEIEIKQFSVVAGIGGPLIDKRRVISEGFLVFKRKDDTKTIGRGSCDIRLPAGFDTISDEHLKIKVVYGVGGDPTIEVRDTSVNGTTNKGVALGRQWNSVGKECTLLLGDSVALNFGFKINSSSDQPKKKSRNESPPRGAPAPPKAVPKKWSCCNETKRNAQGCVTMAHQGNLRTIFACCDSQFNLGCTAAGHKGHYSCNAFFTMKPLEDGEWDCCKGKGVHAPGCLKYHPEHLAERYSCCGQGKSVELCKREHNGRYE